jgi:hypothetical protein
MQTRATAGILARLRAMVRGDKRTVEAQPPAPVVPEPSPAPAPVGAEQPSAKEF